MTRSMALLVARMASSMWVGAALLFVLTSVAEQTSGAFPDSTKNMLALVRFPWFYAMGTILIGVALVASLAVKHASRNVTIGSILLVLALATMALDYVFIYRPLREQIAAAPADRTTEFSRLHHWSEGANACGFLLSVAAAGCLCGGRSVNGRRGNGGDEGLGAGQG